MPSKKGEGEAMTTESVSHRLHTDGGEEEHLWDSFKRREKPATVILRKERQADVNGPGIRLRLSGVTTGK